MLLQGMFASVMGRLTTFGTEKAVFNREYTVSQSARAAAAPFCILPAPTPRAALMPPCQTHWTLLAAGAPVRPARLLLLPRHRDGARQRRPAPRLQARAPSLPCASCATVRCHDAVNETQAVPPPRKHAASSCATCSAIIYFMVGYQVEVEKFFWFALVLVLMDNV